MISLMFMSRIANILDSVAIPKYRWKYKNLPEVLGLNTFDLIIYTN